MVESPFTRVIEAFKWKYYIINGKHVINARTPDGPQVFYIIGTTCPISSDDISMAGH